MIEGTVVIFQKGIPAVYGNPTNAVDGPVGLLVVDVVGGSLFQKTSALGDTSGWLNLSAGGVAAQQSVYTGAAPPVAPNDPTKPAKFYPEQGVDGDEQNWSVANQAWF